MKGKNFSANNLGQRKKSDFYETPYSITKQFLEARSWEGVSYIVEPSCGNGAILKVLREHYDTSFPNHAKTSAFDLYTDFGGKIDFLNYEFTKNVDLIITNPPFSLAEEFILKAKQVSNRYVAFLLPLSYLHGKRRFDRIYNDTDFPLSEVYVFTRYPMLGEELREDGKYNTGMMVYAWYLWDKEHKGNPVIYWLDNNEYVLSKKEK